VVSVLENVSLVVWGGIGFGIVFCCLFSTLGELKGDYPFSYTDFPCRPGGVGFVVDPRICWHLFTVFTGPV